MAQPTEVMKQAFDLLNTGKGVSNPLDALSSGPLNKISAVGDYANKFGSVDAVTQQIFNKVGLNTAMLTTIKGLSTGGAASVVGLVGYGGESVNNFYQRVNIAKSYASTMDSFGVITGCTPFNSTLSMISGIGQRCLDKFNEYFGEAEGMMSAVMNAIEQGLDTVEQLASALVGAIGNVIAMVNQLVEDVKGFIAEELALIQEYITTAINGALASLLPDWVSNECISKVCDTALSPQMKEILS